MCFVWSGPAWLSNGCATTWCVLAFLQLSMFYKHAMKYAEAIRLYKTIKAFLHPGKDLTAHTAVFYSTNSPESVLTYMRKVSWTRSHLLNKCVWWINNRFSQIYYMFGFHQRIMIGALTCPTGWPHEHSRLAGTSHSAGQKYWQLTNSDHLIWHCDFLK